MSYKSTAERLRAWLLRAEHLAKLGVPSDGQVLDEGHRLEEVERERWLDEVEGGDREPDPTEGEREAMLEAFRREVTK